MNNIIDLTTRRLGRTPTSKELHPSSNHRNKPVDPARLDNIIKAKNLVVRPMVQKKDN